MNTVQQILTEYTARKEIQVKRDFNQITQSLEWKRLEQDIDENLKEKVRLLKDVRFFSSFCSLLLTTMNFFCSYS